MFSWSWISISHAVNGKLFHSNLFTSAWLFWAVLFCFHVKSFEKLACFGFSPNLASFSVSVFCCNKNYYYFIYWQNTLLCSIVLVLLSLCFPSEECVFIRTYHQKNWNNRTNYKASRTILHFSSYYFCNVERLASLMSLNISQMNCSFLFQWSEDSKRRKFQTGRSAPVVLHNLSVSWCNDVNKTIPPLGILNKTLTTQKTGLFYS